MRKTSQGDQNAKDALEGNLKLLQSGVLPSERRAAEHASAASLRAGERAAACRAPHGASQPRSTLGLG